MNLFHLLDRVTAKTLRVMDTKEVLQRIELLRRINCLSTVFSQKGVRAGERVLISCCDNILFVISLFALWKIGACAVLVDRKTPFMLIKEYYQKTKSVLYVVFDEHGNSDRKVFSADGINIFLVPQFFRADDLLEVSSVPEGDEAVIFFSSGSIASPKGIILSHRAIWNNVMSILEYMQVRHGDKIMVIKSLAHSSTLVGELLVGLASGSAVFLCECKNITSTIARIHAYQPSVLCLNPTLLKLFVEHESQKQERFMSLRRVYTSGSILTQKLLQSAISLFPNGKIYNVYGLTEAGPRVTAQIQGNATKEGAVGFPIRSVSVMLKNDEKKECRPYEYGQLFLRSPSLMTRYLDGKHLEDMLVDGWFPTNDIAYLDGEGEVHIVGRKDEMIIKNSYNINPANIEKIITQLKGVRECVVFGIKEAVLGEKIVCVLSTRSFVSVRSILDFCAKRLLPIEIPNEFVFWKKIPETTTGKLARSKVKEIYIKNEQKSFDS